MHGFPELFSSQINCVFEYEKVLRSPLVTIQMFVTQKMMQELSLSLKNAHQDKKSSFQGTLGLPQSGWGIIKISRLLAWMGSCIIKKHFFRDKLNLPGFYLEFQIIDYSRFFRVGISAFWIISFWIISFWIFSFQIFTQCPFSFEAQWTMQKGKVLDLIRLIATRLNWY